MGMRILSRLFVTGLIVVGSAAPLVSSAALIPFGGKIVTEWPCFNGGLYFTVLNLGGIGSGAFTFAPGSIPYPWGPPRPGVNTVGIADVPYGCVIGFLPNGVPITWFAPRVFMQGTSLSI